MADRLFLRVVEPVKYIGDYQFPDEQIRLGTDASNCDFVFQHAGAGVSKQHLRVFVDGTALFIEDAHSSNGTYVNGRKIGSGPVVIKSTDELQLGPQGPRFYCALSAFSSEQTTLLEAPSTLMPSAAGDGKPGAETMMLSIKHMRRRSVLLIVSSLIFVVLSCVFALVLYKNAQQEQGVAAQEKQARLIALMAQIQEQQQSIKALQQDTGTIVQERDALLKRAQSQLSTLEGQLQAVQNALRDAAATQEDWSAVTQRVSSSIYLCVFRGADGKQMGIGTAFCVDESGVLATNAHVIEMLKKDGDAVIVQNESNKIYNISRMASHAGFNYRPQSPDVGFIKLKPHKDGQQFKSISLASERDVRELDQGQHLGTIGFPGELLKRYLKQSADGISVVATFKDGWVGRITTFKGELSPDGGGQFIQHSASLSGGTSGSPMLLPQGTVVAISNGGLQNNIMLNGKTSQIVSASEIAFAIRADVIREFAKQVPWVKDL